MSRPRLSMEQWIEAITGRPLRADGRDHLCVMTQEQLYLMDLTFPGACLGYRERRLESGDVEVRLLGAYPDDDCLDDADENFLELLDEQKGDS